MKLFNTRQLYPLLIAGRRKFDTKDFSLLLRVCSILSFRYSITGNLSANEQERIYAGIAERLHNCKVAAEHDVLRSLRVLYIDDNAFVSAFSEIQMKTTLSANKRIARYILFKLEQHLSGCSYDADSSAYNLEHILPENPESRWNMFTDSEQQAYVFRLGNMTLMNTNDNRRIGNKDFENKKAAYTGSIFSITQKIAADNDEWTAARIANRQKWMANQAKTIWSVNQFQ